VIYAHLILGSKEDRERGKKEGRERKKTLGR
jgi:hypothetical protein